jgi:hypothetical protein
VKADRSLPSSEEVKNKRRYTADHPYCFMACKEALHIYLIASSFHGLDDGQRDTPASLKNYVIMQFEVHQLLMSNCWTLAESTVPIQCVAYCTEYYSK